MAAAQFSTPHTEEQERVTQEMRAQGARVPVRTIRDTAPTYSAVAVDVNSNEVILQDNNLWQYQVFDRLTPTPAGPNDISTPKRTVHGDKTLIEFNNGLYVDPERRHLLGGIGRRGQDGAVPARRERRCAPQSGAAHTASRVQPGRR